MMRQPALPIRAFPINAFLAALLVCPAAFAGVYLESSETDLATKAKPNVSKMWFDGGRMRNERDGADAEERITIFKDRAIYSVDTSAKSYRVMDQATIDQMGTKFAAARKQMEAQMANMPPERRAMMEKMLGQMGGGAGTPGAPAAPKRTLKKTGRTESVAGITCTMWEVSVNGVKDTELCAAKPGSVPGGDEVIRTLRELGEMMKSFTQNFGAQARKGASQPWNDMETIDGVPILTRDFENGKASAETRLTAFHKESVAASQFEVPAGYKEKKVSFGPNASKDD
ncbi:MAG: DUF4412 domain-containing protein [Gammaproteobacteria bacterium]